MRLLSVVLALMIVSGVAAAADTTSQPAQPSAPVSKPAPPADTGSPPASAAKPTADAAKPTSAKPVPDPKPDDKTNDRDFKPSEEISEDMAVAYPVDI